MAIVYEDSELTIDHNDILCGVEITSKHTGAKVIITERLSPDLSGILVEGYGTEELVIQSRNGLPVIVVRAKIK